MPEQASGTQTRKSSNSIRQSALPKLLAAHGTGIGFSAAVLLLGIAVVLVHRPFVLSERGDLAIWDYIAQSILRGQVPYRDVIEIKTPLSAYLSAAAMSAGRLVGLRDVLAARLLSALLIGLLSLTTYLVAAVHLRNRLFALVAFLIPLLPSHLVTMVAGTQPKLPMILFGMLTLLLIAKDRPFAAGLFSMLSFLCWQPGLLFTGTAVLILSGGLTSWRDLRAAKALAGAAVPLVLAIAYFYFAGALSDFWAWTITFNLNVYAPREVKGLRAGLALLWKISHQVFASAIILIPFSAAGLVAFTFQSARKLKGKATLRYDNLIPFSIVIPPVVYLAFCLINFQGGPDLIPLFPLVGIFAAWFIAETGSWVASSQATRTSWSSFGFAKVIPGLVIIALLLLLVSRSVNDRNETGLTLGDQNREFNLISAGLSPEDKVYVHGTLEILVLLNKPNLNPYIMFDEGKDDYVAARKYNGSFQEFLSELDAQSPRIISLSRLRRVAHGAEFERWVLERYDTLPLNGYDDIYIRKQ